MAKAILKTQKTELSVTDFLNSIKDEERRADCFTIAEMMKKITKDEPKMWGSAIIGFGNVHLKYESGRELDWFCCGFSPRKANISLYISFDISKYSEMLKKLGKHSTGKGCLYVNKLSDIDLKILEELIQKSVAKKGK